MRQEATCAGVPRPANGVPAFQQLRSRAAPPVAAVRSAGGRYLRKRPNQLCRLPSLSPSTASPISMSRTPVIQKRRMLVVRRRTLTATGTAQHQAAHPRGQNVEGFIHTPMKPQKKKRVYIRDGAAVPPRPISATFPQTGGGVLALYILPCITETHYISMEEDCHLNLIFSALATGAVGRHAHGVQQWGMLVCKAVEGQVPPSRLAYAHPSGKKLQLRRVPCRADGTAVNRRPQQGVWVCRHCSMVCCWRCPHPATCHDHEALLQCHMQVRPRSVLVRKALLKPRLSSGRSCAHKHLACLKKLSRPLVINNIRNSFIIFSHLD